VSVNPLSRAGEMGARRSRLDPFKLLSASALALRKGGAPDRGFPRVSVWKANRASQLVVWRKQDAVRAGGERVFLSSWHVPAFDSARRSRSAGKISVAAWVSGVSDRGPQVTEVGGERGIRTLGRGVTPTRDFQSRRFTHSRISPSLSWGVLRRTPQTPRAHSAGVNPASFADPCVFRHVPASHPRNPRLALCSPGAEFVRVSEGWRRGWDSNPRYLVRHNGFRDRPIQPLSHLSVIELTPRE
jgi:hypothetical protein